MTETELGRAVRNSKDQLFTFYDLRPIYHGHATIFCDEISISTYESESRDSSMLWYFKFFIIQ
jgi:hypothetical protein